MAATEMEIAKVKATKEISELALSVLADGVVLGNSFSLPPAQLDRKRYQEVNTVLESLGGKWNRKTKSHLFDYSPDEAISSILIRGSIDNPKALGFFPTPDMLADRLVDSVAVNEDSFCLEPSAGVGNLALEISRKCGSHRISCVEIDEERCTALRSLGFQDVTNADFLSITPQMFPHKFTHVIMNPPFSVPGESKADIMHVEHAWRFLGSGGYIAAIMSAGFAFRTDKRTKEVRDYFLSIDGDIEMLPDNSFQSSGTSVRTCFLTAIKP